jgi:hypothetical protein
VTKFLLLGVLLLASSAALAVTAVEGTVQKIDATAKTIVVKAADGTEHSFHLAGRTTVHGAEKAAAGAKESFHGLKEGSHVVVHYTTKGTERPPRRSTMLGKGA